MKASVHFFIGLAAPSFSAPSLMFVFWFSLYDAQNRLDANCGEATTDREQLLMCFKKLEGCFTDGDAAFSARACEHVTRSAGNLIITDK